MSKVQPDRWSGLTKFIHWTMVILLFGIGIVGLTMGDIDNPHQKITVYALHKSMGITALTLAAIRLLLRIFTKSPARITTIPSWQHAIGSITHALLYVFMFLIPLSGWTMNSASGYPLQYFKLFNLPALTAKSESVAELAASIHYNSFLMLTGLAIVHAGAAFYHHIFQGDATLRRMLPGKKPL